MTTQNPGQAQDAAPAAPPAPVPSQPQDGGFDPAKWLGGLTPEQRAAVDEYATYRLKPLESEKHGYISEIGRLKKAADPQIVARLSNEERLLEQHKAAAASLYGLDTKDLEDVDSVDALNVALRLLTRAVPKQPAKPQAPAGVEPDTWAEYLAFKQAKGQPPAQAPGAQRTEPIAPRGGAVVGQVDLGTALQQYEAALKSGNSKAIESAIAAMSKARATAY